jgi:hypothetical protein
MTRVDDDREWKPCFDVAGVKLPTGYFIGFTAATGDLSDNHDILTVKFYELEGPAQVSCLSFHCFSFSFKFIFFWRVHNHAYV